MKAGGPRFERRIDTSISITSTLPPAVTRTLTESSSRTIVSLSISLSFGSAVCHMLLSRIEWPVCLCTRNSDLFHHVSQCWFQSAKREHQPDVKVQSAKAGWA